MSRDTLGRMISPLTIEAAVLVLVTSFLVAGATIRMSRFVTTDSLGGWLIREPAQRWADKRETAYRLGMVAEAERLSNLDPDGNDAEIQDEARALLQLVERDEPFTKGAKLVSGLYCPFCVGFWIGAVFVIATLLIGLLPVFFVCPWLAILAILTLNYIVGHISSRID